ncbi:MAG: glycosyltransferase family 4 protein [Nanoarchaeota archaeon]|nr:glycosyltransferase family 4 protein [Nanoarchaeota archaeon]
MKIGFLLSSFHPFTGGREILTLNFAKELAKRGHEVHVFTSLAKDLKKEEVVHGVHIHRSRTWLKYKYYLEFNPGWIWNSLKHRLDIFQVQSFGFVFADIAAVLKRMFSKAVVLNSPMGPFMALEKYNWWQTILKKVYTVLEWPVNRLYTKVIAINPGQWRWMVNCGVRKADIIFIPPSVESYLFAQYNKKPFVDKYNLKGKFVISYIGRIQKYKGLDQVITVLPEILKKHKNIVFLAMGKDADDVERLNRMAKDLDVENNVIFTGPVSEEEKIQGLDVSNIFVFPSEWEAFGIVLVEAFARGNAVISTKTEGGKYLVKEGVNGFLYDYKDTKALEKHILKLIEDDKLRKTIISNNIKKAHGFSTEKVTDELERLYLALLKK